MFCIFTFRSLKQNPFVWTAVSTLYEKCVWVFEWLVGPPSFHCSAFLQAAALYGLSSPGYGLLVCLSAYSLCTLHRGGSHSETHRHKSTTKLGLSAYCSITSLSVSYCSRSLHTVSSLTANWMWRSVLTTLGVHLQKCHQAYARSSPHKDGQKCSAGISKLWQKLYKRLCEYLYVCLHTRVRINLSY